MFFESLFQAGDHDINWIKIILVEKELNLIAMFKGGGQLKIVIKRIEYTSLDVKREEIFIIPEKTDYNKSNNSNYEMFISTDDYREYKGGVSSNWIRIPNFILATAQCNPVAKILASSQLTFKLSKFEDSKSENLKKLLSS